MVEPRGSGDSRQGSFVTFLVLRPNAVAFDADLIYFNLKFQAVKASPVVLFMKGNPDQPMCGFSRTVVQILDMQGVPREKMHSYNVLDDPELRTSIKEYS